MERETENRPSGRSAGVRAVRAVAIGLACALAAVLALAAVVALTPPFRAVALREGLRAADGRLPGVLVVERATWPRASQVVLTGVCWTDASDTLATIRRLEVAVALRRLIRREYEIRAVQVEGLRADVPAILARFASRDGNGAPEAKPERGPFDPDSLPKLSIEGVRIEDVRVRVTPALELVASELDLQADLRGDGGPRTLALRGRALAREDLGVSFRLEAALSDSLVVRLARIHLGDPAQLPDPSSLPLDGRLAATLSDLLSLGGDDRWPRLSAQGIAVTGALGDLDLDAEIHGREPGRIRGRVAPRQPPPWLAALVVAALPESLGITVRPYLAERWPREAPPTLSWDADVTPPAPGAGDWPPRAAAAAGEFVLPGPGDLAPLLPPRLRVDDLGALRGRYAVRYAGSGDSTRVRLDLDLDGTEWLRAGRVALETDARDWIDVDSLTLEMSGLALRARGRLDRDRLDATAVGDVSSSLLARWDDPALRGIRGRLHADVAAAGSRHRPRVGADLSGRLEARGLTLPEYSARVDLDEGRLVLALVAPDGLRYGATVFDTLSLAADVRSFDGVLPRSGDLTLAGGGGHGAFVVPWVDLTAALDGRRVTLAASLPSGLSHGASVVDSATLDLDVTARDTSFVLREGRLRLTAAGRHGEIAVPRLDLDGRLADSTVALDLELPAGLAVGETRVDSLRCRFAGGFGDSLSRISGRLDAVAATDTARWDLGTDVAFSRRGGPVAVRARVDRFELSRLDRGVVLQHPCEVAWDAGDSLLRIEGLDLRGRLGRLKCDLSLAPSRTTGDVTWELGAPMSLVRDLLPEGFAFAAKAESIALGGRLTLSGTAADPSAYLTAMMELRESGGTPELEARAEGWLLNPASPPDAGWPAAPADAPARGVAARALLSRGEQPLLDASARLPWSVSLLPASFLPNESDPGVITAHADNLDLAVLNDLLPAGTRLSGNLDLDLKVAGTPSDFAVDGRAAGRKVVLNFSDGSWVNAEGEFGLVGDADSLEATGTITVAGGLLRVPETPPSLLPTSGELMLETPSADTVAAAPADSIAPAAPRRLPLAAAAVKVRIPGNVWIRGRGLNVEIAGDLTVGSRAGRPIVQGDLRAVEGNLKLFGHFFTLEHGLVVFKDDAESLDPDLDIRMKTRVGEATYFVQLLGSVAAPQIELQSEPAMSEQDIVSSLVTGRTPDEFDETGQAADRAGEVLAAYGSVKLQDWASGQMGVDLVSVEPSKDDDEKSSLVVGKYLNPKVVVRYEKVMDEESAWYVHLDYLISNFVKLHSEIFDGGSGLEMTFHVDR